MAPARAVLSRRGQAADVLPSRAVAPHGVIAVLPAARRRRPRTGAANREDRRRKVALVPTAVHPRVRRLLVKAIVALSKADATIDRIREVAVRAAIRLRPAPTKVRYLK